MARIIRTQISGEPVVYVRLRKDPLGTNAGQYVAHEEGTGLVLAEVHHTASSKGWVVQVMSDRTEGEPSHVIVPTLFAAAQVIGNARSRYLRAFRARRDAALAVKA